MQSKNKSKNKKIQNIIVFAGLSAVVLVVSTFAWFIGRQEVGVNSFTVNVSAIEHLELSMNGVVWDDTIDITNGAWTIYDAAADAADPEASASAVYDGHTNSWGTGLVPVSSAGEINTESSRLTIFEKSSFTRTAGGFKVLSDIIDNGPVDPAADPVVMNAENPGYVAFDLFVKNSSGNTYFEAYNPTQEEEIFLTYNSAAVADDSGSAESQAAGVENSIRVAFLQVGRVNGNTTVQDTITGIDCAGGAGVTAICQDNRSTIWEPNDTAHNAESLAWFTDNCTTRVASATNLLDAASYTTTACTGFEADTYYPTNVIHEVIPAESAAGVATTVDIYDGFNTQTPNATYVTPLNTFTDTEKVNEGDARNPFMFLAPNSITKIRVYIYLEGMDLDNQDLAEVLASEVVVNFGFSKQQYETDTDFNGAIDNTYDPNRTP